MKLPNLNPKGLVSLRFIVISIITIIVLVVVGFGIAIYGFHKDTSTIRTVEKIVPYPIALVNWSPIYLHDYNFTRDFTLHFYAASKTSYNPTQVNQQILDQLINQKIVDQHAAPVHVTVSQSEIDDAYNKLQDKSGKDEVNKVLSDLYGLDDQQFKQLIYQQLLQQKIQAYYVQKNDWHQVEVRHILFKVDPNADAATVAAVKAKAEAELQQIKAGRSFAAAAQADSEDVDSKDQGGELGYVSRGQTLQPFEDAIFAPGVKKGDLLGPIRTQYGWHIILVEGIRGQNDFQIWRNQAKVHQLLNV